MPRSCVGSAHRHQAASVGGRQPHEDGATACGADPEAKLVVLGQAVGIERTVAIPGDGGKRVARDRAADAGGRHRGAHGLAHHHLLAMRLREFTAIMTRDECRGEPVAAHGHCMDGNLDERETFDQHIVQGQFVGVDDILGVMQHHRLYRRAVCLFVGEHRLPDPVETARLGRRPRSVADDEADVRIVPRRPLDRRDRLGIIGVASDIERMRWMAPAHGI
jgi:hypothetical protein